MPTVQQLLTTIDATYRNSYSSDLKVQWMDVTQKQIFQRVPKEAIPYTFQTIADNPWYPLPSDCDRFGIKSVTIETSPGSNRYEEVQYLSIEGNRSRGEFSEFYSLLNKTLFINPIPRASTQGKNVCMIYNKQPTTISLATLDQSPELEYSFHELLILGCLERIARARGEIEDKNNFAADYAVLLQDYIRQYKLRQPEYYSPKDVMPARGLGRSRSGGRRWMRNSVVSDLIPPN